MRLAIALVIGLASASAVAQEADAVRVMSFNIRYNNPADGPNAWPLRKDWVAEILREKADVAGLQEVRKEQLDDLKERLPDFEFYGVGRDDGKEAGEFVPLAWRKDRFTATDKGVFWLSETPDQPSQGWDAALPRVTTWAKLTDRTTGRSFLAVNTHFDHRGAEARKESGTQLRTWIADHAGDAPVILTGDFNTLPRSEPYQNLVENGTLRDARQVAAEREGPESTWNGFQEVVPGRRIDFIFVAGSVKVGLFETLVETRQGRYASDHLPIVAAVKLSE